MNKILILALFILSSCTSPEVLGVSVTDADGVAGILLTIAVFGLAWFIKCWIEYLFSVRLEIKKRELDE
jgi:hypothetical protein